ncbi:MAG: flippase-like domain-containing protein [Oscillospiraceae bacterium]|nr:flippase-like domain-containing protein [Oscillospiraceae bacterium]
MRVKIQWKNIACTGAVCALLAWTVYTIFQQQTPGQLAAALLSADWRILLLGVPLMALFVCCEAKATHSILHALGSAQPFRRCAYYSCVGFFFSTITPSATGGQPAQVVAMGKDGTPAATGALDMLLVTIGYNTAAMGWGIFALTAAGGLTERLGGQVGLLLGFGLAVFAVLDVAMFLFLFLPGPTRRLLYGCIALGARIWPALDKSGLEARADEHLAEYRRGAGLIRRSPLLLVEVVGLSALQLACSYAMPYVVYRAFGLSGFSLWEVMALQALCAIAVGYLPLPGSAGAAENVFLRGFLLVYGQGLVAPAMILSRTLNCYLVLIATAIVLAAGRGLRRRKESVQKGGQPDALRLTERVKKAVPVEGAQ